MFFKCMHILQKKEGGRRSGVGVQTKMFILRMPASVAQLAAKVGKILSWRFDHEIFSTVILSLPLIQEGQLSVSGERMCSILVNRLED